MALVFTPYLSSDSTWLILFFVEYFHDGKGFRSYRLSWCACKTLFLQSRRCQLVTTPPPPLPENKTLHVSTQVSTNIRLFFFGQTAKAFTAQTNQVTCQTPVYLHCRTDGHKQPPHQRLLPPSPPLPPYLGSLCASRKT